jgi:hypothetical protein
MAESERPRRTAVVARKTKETDIEVEIDLDGTGKQDIETGIGFLDHMFSAMSKHGRFDLRLKLVFRRTRFPSTLALISHRSCLAGLL